MRYYINRNVAMCDPSAYAENSNAPATHVATGAEVACIMTNARGLVYIETIDLPRLAAWVSVSDLARVDEDLTTLFHRTQHNRDATKRIVR